MTNDTIFALSSGALPAAIAIVRLSGPRADKATSRLVGSLPELRRASLRRLRSDDGAVIDEALVLRFPGPQSATGEPLIEFHLHGGRAVVARFLQVLGAMPGLREAEPGEFTRRALLNGRLNLTQAEGLGDLLSAETEWQRRVAVESAGGAVSRRVESWRERLVTLSAQAEAAIDYVGDEDETSLDVARLGTEVQTLVEEWRGWLARPTVELLQNGLRIVLAGAPNSGKSSLFNALVGSDRAIVTDVAGTTRDILEARLDLDGILVQLVDTAGLRESDDTVERIGIQRAEDAVSRADIVLWLGDPADAPAGAIRIHAKADERGPSPVGSIPTSVRSGLGITALLEVLTREAASHLPSPDLTPFNRRQHSLLREALLSLKDIRGADLLFLAEGLRHALGIVDRITGRSGTEDVLDAVFARFCLGK